MIPEPIDQLPVHTHEFDLPAHGHPVPDVVHRILRKVNILAAFTLGFAAGLTCFALYLLLNQ